MLSLLLLLLLYIVLSICILIDREPTDNSNYQCAPAIFQLSFGYLQKRACIGQLIGCYL